jgi:hypothetical protein
MHEPIQLLRPENELARARETSVFSWKLAHQTKLSITSVWLRRFPRVVKSWPGHGNGHLKLVPVFARQRGRGRPSSKTLARPPDAPKRAQRPGVRLAVFYTRGGADGKLVALPLTVSLAVVSRGRLHPFARRGSPSPVPGQTARGLSPSRRSWRRPGW